MCVVARGNWHGDVAIKMLKMDPTLEGQAQLQAFKLEVRESRSSVVEHLPSNHKVPGSIPARGSW